MSESEARRLLEAWVAPGKPHYGPASETRAFLATPAPAADDAAEALAEALEALLRQTNNIEVLGEWAAEDRNWALSRKVRAEVDAVKEQSYEAIAAYRAARSKVQP